MKLIKSFNLFLFLFILNPYGWAQCDTLLDVTTYEEASSDSTFGSWSLNTDTVFQGANGGPTFFISPDSMINYKISGRFMSAGFFDDDFYGLTFGHRGPIGVSNEYDCYIFDWKQAAGTINGYYAEEGYALFHVKGYISNDNDTLRKYFWSHTANSTLELLGTDYGSTKGWTNYMWYDFELLYTSDRIRIKINQNVIFDVQGTFQSGRLGFYNFSQWNTYYTNLKIDSNFTYKSISVCPGDSMFINGKYESAEGIYYDTLTTQAGCDSFLVYELGLDSSMCGLSDTCLITDTNYITVYDTSLVYDTITFMDTVVFMDTVTYTDTMYYHDTIISTELIWDTVLIYDTITVADTLEIDVVLSGLSPPSNNSNIKVYPNPAYDMLVIENSNYAMMTGYTLRILNVQSQVVYTTLMNQALHQVNTSQLGSAGTYVLQILDPSQNLAIKKYLILY